MKQSVMNISANCDMISSRSLTVLSNTVAAFNCGVRFFAYSVFYYFFYYGLRNNNSQRIFAH